PYCGLLLMNHVPFDVVLDDDVAEGRLRGYDTLVIPRGDTLTKTVHQRIVEFARSGKKVIADKSLRARVPGAVIAEFDFTLVRVAAPGKPALYDALARKPVSFTSEDGQAAFEVALPPAQGMLIAVLPEKIGKVEIEAPGKPQRGKRWTITARVLGASGKPLKG